MAPIPDQYIIDATYKWNRFKIQLTAKKQILPEICLQCVLEYNIIMIICFSDGYLAC